MGANSVRWIEEEVDQWIQTRPTAVEEKSPVALFNALPAP